MSTNDDESKLASQLKVFLPDGQGFVSVLCKQTDSVYNVARSALLSLLQLQLCYDALDVPVFFPAQLRFFSAVGGSDQSGETSDSDDEDEQQQRGAPLPPLATVSDLLTLNSKCAAVFTGVAPALEDWTDALTGDCGLGAVSLVALSPAAPTDDEDSDPEGAHFQLLAPDTGDSYPVYQSLINQAALGGYVFESLSHDPWVAEQNSDEDDDEETSGSGVMRVLVPPGEQKDDDTPEAGFGLWAGSASQVCLNSQVLDAYPSARGVVTLVYATKGSRDQLARALAACKSAFERRAVLIAGVSVARLFTQDDSAAVSGAVQTALLGASTSSAGELPDWVSAEGSQVFEEGVGVAGFRLTGGPNPEVKKGSSMVLWREKNLLRYAKKRKDSNGPAEPLTSYTGVLRGMADPSFLLIVQLSKRPLPLPRLMAMYLPDGRAFRIRVDGVYDESSEAIDKKRTEQELTELRDNYFDGVVGACAHVASWSLSQSDSLEQQLVEVRGWGLSGRLPGGVAARDRDLLEVTPQMAWRLLAQGESGWRAFKTQGGAVVEAELCLGVVPLGVATSSTSGAPQLLSHDCQQVWLWWRREGVTGGSRAVSLQHVSKLQVGKQSPIMRSLDEKTAPSNRCVTLSVTIPTGEGTMARSGSPRTRTINFELLAPTAEALRLFVLAVNSGAARCMEANGGDSAVVQLAQISGSTTSGQKNDSAETEDDSKSEQESEPETEDSAGNSAQDEATGDESETAADAGTDSGESGDENAGETKTTDTQSSGSRGLSHPAEKLADATRWTFMHGYGYNKSKQVVKRQAWVRVDLGQQSDSQTVSAARLLWKRVKRSEKQQPSPPAPEDDDSTDPRIKALSLMDVLWVKGGKETELLQSEMAADAPADHCFTLETEATHLDLQCASMEQRDSFVGTILQALEQLAESLKTDQQQQSGGEDNAPASATATPAGSEAEPSTSAAAADPSEQEPSETSGAEESVTTVGDDAGSSHFLATLPAGDTVSDKDLYAALHKGCVFSGFAFSKSGSIKRDHVFIFVDAELEETGGDSETEQSEPSANSSNSPELVPYLYWCSPREPRRKNPRKRLPLADIKYVLVGALTDVLKQASANADRSFSVLAERCQLDLVASDGDSVAQWACGGLDADDYKRLGGGAGVRNLWVSGLGKGIALFQDPDVLQMVESHHQQEQEEQDQQDQKTEEQGGLELPEGDAGRGLTSPLNFHRGSPAPGGQPATTKRPAIPTKVREALQVMTEGQEWMGYALTPQGAVRRPISLFYHPFTRENRFVFSHIIVVATESLNYPTRPLSAEEELLLGAGETATGSTGGVQERSSSKPESQVYATLDLLDSDRQSLLQPAVKQQVRTDVVNGLLSSYQDEQDRPNRVHRFKRGNFGFVPIFESKPQLSQHIEYIRVSVHQYDRVDSDRLVGSGVIPVLRDGSAQNNQDSTPGDGRFGQWVTLYRTPAGPSEGKAQVEPQAVGRVYLRVVYPQVGSDAGVIYWSDLNSNKNGQRVMSPQHCLPVKDIKEVFIGKVADVFQTQVAALARRDCCMSVGNRFCQLELEAPTAETLQAWVKGLTYHLQNTVRQAFVLRQDPKLLGTAADMRVLTGAARQLPDPSGDSEGEGAGKAAVQYNSGDAIPYKHVYRAQRYLRDVHEFYGIVARDTQLSADGTPARTPFSDPSGAVDIVRACIRLSAWDEDTGEGTLSWVCERFEEQDQQGEDGKDTGEDEKGAESTDPNQNLLSSGVLQLNEINRVSYGDRNASEMLRLSEFAAQTGELSCFFVDTNDYGLSFVADGPVHAEKFCLALHSVIVNLQTRATSHRIPNLSGDVSGNAVDRAVMDSISRSNVRLTEEVARLRDYIKDLKRERDVWERERHALNISKQILSLVGVEVPRAPVDQPTGSSQDGDDPSASPGGSEDGTEGSFSSKAQPSALPALMDGYTRVREMKQQLAMSQAETLRLGAELKRARQQLGEARNQVALQATLEQDLTTSLQAEKQRLTTSLEKAQKDLGSIGQRHAAEIKALQDQLLVQKTQKLKALRLVKEIRESNDQQTPRLLAELQSARNANAQLQMQLDDVVRVRNEKTALTTRLVTRLLTVEDELQKSRSKDREIRMLKAQVAALENARQHNDYLQTAESSSGLGSGSGGQVFGSEDVKLNSSTFTPSISPSPYRGAGTLTARDSHYLPSPGTINLDKILAEARALRDANAQKNH